MIDRDETVLLALMAHSRHPKILDLHLDNCDDQTCVRCIPETPAEHAARIVRLVYPTAEDWARLDMVHVKAPAGEVAEYVHIKCDADPGATTPPFPYLRKGVRARRGGQS